MSNPTQLPQSNHLRYLLSSLQSVVDEIYKAAEEHAVGEEPDITADELEAMSTGLLNGIEQEVERAIRELARLEGTEFVVDDEEADQSDYENPEEEEEAEFSDSTSEERSEILSSTTEYEDEIVSEEDE